MVESVWFLAWSQASVFSNCYHLHACIDLCIYVSICLCECAWMSDGDWRCYSTDSFERVHRRVRCAGNVDEPGKGTRHRSKSSMSLHQVLLCCSFLCIPQSVFSLLDDCGCMSLILNACISAHRHGTLSAKEGLHQGDVEIDPSI